MFFFFFFQAEDGIRDKLVTGVQTCALPISSRWTATSGPTWMRATSAPCRRSPVREVGPSRRFSRPRAKSSSAARTSRRRTITTAGRASSRSSGRKYVPPRSEEHTSELQSLAYLVCRLLLEKKKQDGVARSL